MDLWNLIVRFFQGGGDFMYPIAIVLVFGLAIAIERYIYLTRAAVQNRGLWNEVVPLISKGDFRQVVQITSKSQAAIAQILNYGLARIQSARRRDDIEKANQLSASISVAMNCTAFGLMTAVPLLFIHAWLQTKTTEIIDSLEMASVKFLNAITERRPEPAQAA